MKWVFVLAVLLTSGDAMAKWKRADRQASDPARGERVSTSCKDDTGCSSSEKCVKGECVESGLPGTRKAEWDCNFKCGWHWCLVIGVKAGQCPNCCFLPVTP